MTTKFKVGDKVKIKLNHTISQPDKFSHHAIYDIINTYPNLGLIRLKQYTNETFDETYFVLYEEKSVGFIIE